MPIYKGVRVKSGYTKMSHHDFWELLLRVYQGMLNNLYFSKPPIAISALKAKMDQYSAAISATMSGAKVQFAQRDSLRHDLEGMLRLLGTYVEQACEDDENIAKTSGFDLQPSTHEPARPLDTQRIRKLDHGSNSGEILVWPPRSYRKIRTCDLRYVPVDDAGLPVGDWTETVITDFLKPITIKNLKPGVVYAFQIRALGDLGKTDWSDSVTIMCI